MLGPAIMHLSEHSFTLLRDLLSGSLLQHGLWNLLLKLFKSPVDITSGWALKAKDPTAPIRLHNETLIRHAFDCA